MTASVLRGRPPTIQLPHPIRIGLLLLTGLPLLAGCGGQSADPEAAQAPVVGVIEAAERKVNPFFEFVGKTRAAETVELRARVIGFLEERNFEEGGDVEQGQVLFRIEPDRYEAALAQAEANLAAAEASLNQARVDLARYEELLKAKNISAQKVDEARAVVLVQEAAVQTAEAAIRQAQLDVDYTEVTAPIAGRIDLARYDVGNLVGPEAGVLATINQMDPIRVAFSIAETWYLQLVQAGVEAKKAGRADAEAAHVPLIRLPDGSLYGQQGEFDFIDNKVDEKTGTVLIRAVFANPDRLLLPGQFVTVVIEREEAVEAVTIPQAAVLTDQAGSYVLVVDGENTVRSRRIATGQRFGGDLVVTEGLEPGARLVLYGLQKVRPGITVTPELAAAPADPLQGETSPAPGEPGTDAGGEGPADGEGRADAGGRG